MELQSVSKADVSGESHSWQEAWEEVDERDQEGDCKTTSAKCLDVTSSAAVDALEEVVLPGVQFDHLDVVDGLSGDLHPLILALHNLDLGGSHHLANQVV